MKLYSLFLLPLIFFAYIQNVNAQQKRALIIGNADYSHPNSLPHPVNDAEDISSMLNDLHFITTVKKNLSYKQMNQAINSFSATIEKGDVALFFYAGHGIQSKDLKNYLIPLNAHIYREVDLKAQAISANLILTSLEGKQPALKIIILDACRDNPFPSMRKSRGSTISGLAKMEVSMAGTIIVYAAGAGKKASDGSGKNSLFTDVLLKWIDKPGVEIVDMFRNVSTEVSQNKEADQQVPLVALQAPPTFYFTGGGKFENNMISIAGGTFQMGCVSGKKCGDDEKVHLVKVNRFAIGKYEVTEEEWAICVQEGGCNSYKSPAVRNKGRNSFFNIASKSTALYPVVNVSLHDINEYIHWLNKRTGLNYRLPTESEWEYAARAGSKTAYPWGNGSNCSKANYNSTNCDTHGVHEVGSYVANAWGLHDVVGNAAEWTSSVYEKNYMGSESIIANRRNQRLRAIRGGSWSSNPSFARLADRSMLKAFEHNNDVGFRLAITRKVYSVLDAK